MVFITMLIALFFSTLFYKPATEPLCLDSDDKSTCVSFVENIPSTNYRVYIG